MIPKKDLINGAHYLGFSRNTEIAQWLNGKFIFIGNVFGSPYIETIEHYEDTKNTGFDGFIPFAQAVPSANTVLQEKQDADYHNHARNLYKNLNSMSLDGEEWRLVPDYENYSVSNYGRVKHNTKNRIIRQNFNREYLVLGLTNIHKTRTNFRVHRLVAMVFVPHPYGTLPFDASGFEVNHKNGIKTDNRATNLEWLTHAENSAHMFASGNVIRKLTPAIVKEIKQLLADGNIAQKDIAANYQISESVVSEIRTGKKWATI